MNGSGGSALRPGHDARPEPPKGGVVLEGGGGSGGATIPPGAVVHVPADSPRHLLAVIAQAVSDPALDVAKMERLLAMHKEITEEQRRVAFAGAMARLQAKLPQITKDGRIVVNGTERSRYARIEDIDTAIRPLLAEEGFAFSFDTLSTEKGLLISCTLAHREGHSETKSLMLPIDMQGAKSNVQGVGSTVSYGRRYLLKMHLNLIEREEDDDGQGGAAPITEKQMADLMALLTEVGADQTRFLTYMGVARLDDILGRDYKKALNAVETKRRKV